MITAAQQGFQTKLDAPSSTTEPGHGSWPTFTAIPKVVARFDNFWASMATSSSPSDLSPNDVLFLRQFVISVPPSGSLRKPTAFDRGRDARYRAPTRSPEAVARLRFPQNVACGC